jgi:hypothetical protein
MSTRKTELEQAPSLFVSKEDRNTWRVFWVSLLIICALNRHISFYVAIAAALYFALKRIAGDWNQTVTSTPNVYFLMASVAVLIMLPLGIEKFGVESPGDFFERSEYEARLYVHLYPEAQRVKSYRVPAMISAEGGEYLLWSAFMPKGVSIDFEDCRVELQKTVICFDTSNRTWGIVLTPTPAL